ncbi:hypothetical protein KSP39_PZI015105 [Platanthera zijinensis]|uniref:Uncharacterized protein n=1 Tax=Platanthera zijinensis TaxID=2320716 RepID=A0AAP0BBU9_9ASPA
MEDDDDPPSHTPSPSSSYRSLSPSPPPAPISVVHPSAMPPLNGHPSDSVTVAAPAPNHQTLTLALPIQHPPGSSGSGREDCWSDGATSALIDAWGEHFLELSRGNLKQNTGRRLPTWSAAGTTTPNPREPTSSVRIVLTPSRRNTSSREPRWPQAAYRPPPPPGPSTTASTSSSAPSLRSPLPPPPPNTRLRPPLQRPHALSSRRSSGPSSDEKEGFSPPATATAFTSSTSDSLPPITPGLAAANGRQKGIQTAGMRELTRAILKFGEVYHKVESSKLQQAMEMEKQRMGFARELRCRGCSSL